MFFQSHGYKINEYVHPSRMFNDMFCYAVEFYTKPFLVDPSIVGMNPDEFYELFSIDVCPISYCNLSEKTKLICDAIIENQPSDYILPNKYLGRNEKFLAFLYFSAGDLHYAAGWIEEDFEKEEDKLIDSFHFFKK